MSKQLGIVKGTVPYIARLKLEDPRVNLKRVYIDKGAKAPRVT